MWLLSCLIVGAAFASSIDQLRDELEAEFPGSIEWLVEWAREEEKIEYFRHLIEGHIPVPPGFIPLRICDLAGLIHYLYEPETPEVVARIVTKAILRGIFVSDVPLPALVNRVVQFRGVLTTLPAEAFQMIANNDSPATIHAALQHTQQRRFADLERIAGIIRIWRRFCLDELHAKTFSLEPPCYQDPVSGVWVLGRNTAASFFRSNLLLAIRLRERSGAVGIAALSKP